MVTSNPANKCFKPWMPHVLLAKERERTWGECAEVKENTVGKFQIWKTINMMRRSNKKVGIRSHLSKIAKGNRSQIHIIPHKHPPPPLPQPCASPPTPTSHSARLHATPFNCIYEPKDSITEAIARRIRVARIKHSGLHHVSNSPARLISHPATLTLSRIREAVRREGNGSTLPTLIKHEKPAPWQKRPLRKVGMT